MRSEMANNDIKIMPKAVVCEDCTFRGDITIMSGCVIHSSASILAEAGPIVLDENCIVEEYATIINRRCRDRSVGEVKTDPCALYIGANNVFEVGCTVEALRIGERNLFECKSYVGPNVAVSSGCIIGAGVRLSYNQELPENTVIYRSACRQREAIDKHASQTLQIDFLRKVLPNYHHLRKPNCDPKKSRSN